MKLVTIVDDELRLCSNLDEYRFGKTNYNSILSQEGYLFDGKNFGIWNFSEVKSYETEKSSERIVFYCGKNPLSKNAKSLMEYFETNDEKLLQAVKTVCKALTIAAKNGTTLPVIGAGGIFLDLSEDNDRVLFLPQDLFKYSAAGLSKEEEMAQNGCWINETLTGLPAACFERAVITYRLLTGRLPFPSTDILEHNSDILDQKFLPLELSLDGVNAELSKNINRALKLNSNVINIPGKKQKGKTIEDLRPVPDFPLDLLDEAFSLSKEKKNTLSNKEFEEKASAYMKLQQSKINTKRKIRKNYATIAAVSGILLIIGFIISNTIKTRMSDLTSIGLTSTQTIQAFFHGVNTKDTVLLSNIAKGKNPDNYTDTVGRIYVIDKQRKAYDRDNGFAYPENWLLYSTDEKKYERSSVYGVTNIKIDGKPAELNIKIYQKNESPEPLTKEGNITLENGSESVHKVEYFLIHSEGENNNFVVEKITDIFSLQFKKNRWIITDIESENTVLPVRSSNFKTEYLNLLEKNNGDVKETVKELRTKYEWLPTETAIENEKKLMEYKASHPFEDLGF